MKNLIIKAYKETKNLQVKYYLLRFLINKKITLSIYGENAMFKVETILNNLNFKPHYTRSYILATYYLY